MLSIDVLMYSFFSRTDVFGTCISKFVIDYLR